MLKLRMAPNSLFAVLLRSPWWISLLVALGLGLVARMLLPEAYAIPGMLAGFPFLVIAAIALWRQWGRPGAAQVQRTLEAAAAMKGTGFLQAMEQSYERQGYRASRPQDADVDIALARGGETVLVVCKRWKAGNHGVEPLRALAQARRARGASRAVYVSLGEAGDAARRFAREQGIELLHGVELAHLLGPLTTTKR